MLLWPEPPIRARPTPAVTAPALVGGESWLASATAALRGTALSGGGCRPDRCILCRPGPGDLPAASVSDEWEDQQARGTLSRGAPSLFLQPLPLGEPPAATLRTPPLV